MQCFECWLCGHVSTSCSNTERCGGCAGEHNHRNCPKGAAAKCVVCGGGHTAWSKECPSKKEDIERTKPTKANTPHNHGTTQLCGPNCNLFGGGLADMPDGSRQEGRRLLVTDSEGFVTPK